MRGCGEGESGVLVLLHPHPLYHSCQCVSLTQPTTWIWICLFLFLTLLRITGRQWPDSRKRNPRSSVSADDAACIRCTHNLQCAGGDACAWSVQDGLPSTDVLEAASPQPRRAHLQTLPGHKGAVTPCANTVALTSLRGRRAGPSWSIRRKQFPKVNNS